MTAAELLGGAGATAVVAVLLAACAGHLARPGTLTGALAAHRVLPAPRTVAALVVLAEGGLGVAGAIGLVRGDRPVAALLGGATLLALLGGYGAYVLETGRGGPCGCSLSDLPMSGWTVARAFLLAGLALAGGTLADPVAPLGRPGAQQAVLLLAAATLGLLIWQLPAALHDPVPSPHRSRPVGAGGR